MSYVTQTANVALTTAAAQLASIGGAAPGKLAIGYVPEVTAVAAGDSVTVSILQGATVLGTAVATNSGAGAAAVGPIVVMAPIPADSPAVITLSALTSASTGTAAASATSPIMLALL